MKSSKISNAVARFICSMNMTLNYPLPIYIIVYGVSCLHMYKIMTLPNSQISQVIGYTDYSSFMKAFWNLYIFAFSQAIITFFFITKAILANWHQELSENSFMQIWTTKFIGNFAFIVCHAFSLPIINFSIRTLQSLQINDEFKTQPYAHQPLQMTLAWVNLILLFLNTQTLTILVFDHRPFSKNIYASLNHIDLIKVMPVIQYVMAIIFCLNRYQPFSPVFPFIFTLIMILVAIKQPILQYNYEMPAKILVYSKIWVFIIRIINIVNGFVPYPLILGGLAMWNIMLIYISRIILKRILLKPDPTARQIKTLLYLLKHLDKRNELTLLYMYLLLHKGKCKDLQCSSRKYKTLHKFDQDSNYYYLTLKDIIKLHFQDNTIFAQEETQKDQFLKDGNVEKMGKLIDVFVHYTSIISVKDQRHNLALHKIQKMMYVADKTQSIFLGLRVNYFDYKINYQKLMGHQIAKQSAQNQYAKKYGRFQMQLEKFYQILIRLKSNNLNLWRQMKLFDPKVKEVFTWMMTIIQDHQKIEKSYENMIQIFPQSQRLLRNFYYEYQRIICNKNPSTKAKIEMHPTNIDINMKKYNYNAKTGVIKVSLNQGQDFGRISFANMFLKQAIQAPNNLNLKDNRIKIYKFIPQDLHEIHDEKIKRFVYSNPIEAVNYLAFLVTMNGNIKQISTLSQIASSFINGLQVVTFISVQPSKRLILCNQKGVIKYFSTQFLEEIIQGLEIDHTNLKTLNRETLRKLIESQNRDIVIEVGSVKFKVILLRVFGDQKRPCYLCEFLFENQAPKSSNFGQEEYIASSILLQPALYNGKEKLENKTHARSSFYGLKKNLDCESKDPVIKKQQQNKLPQNDKQNPEKINNEKISKELDKLYQVTSDLKGGLRLKVFTCLSVFLLLTYIILPIILIVLSTIKFAAIDIFMEKNEMLHSFLPTMSRAVISLRQMNVQALDARDNDRFLFLKERIKIYNEELIQLIKKLPTGNFTDIQKFDILDNGQIQLTSMPYFLLLREQILVSLTYLTNFQLSDFDMALRNGQMAHLMPSAHRKFHQVIFNSLDGVFGRQENFYQSIIEDQLCILGKCLEKDLTLYISVSGMLIPVAVLGLFMHYYFKINKIKLQAFRIFSLIPDEIVCEKLEKLEKYSLNYLQQNQQIQQGTIEKLPNQTQDGGKKAYQTVAQQSIINKARKNLKKRKISKQKKAEQKEKKQERPSQKKKSFTVVDSQNIQIKKRNLNRKSNSKFKLPSDSSKLNYKRKFIVPSQNLKEVSLRFILIGIPLVLYFMFFGDYQVHFDINESQKLQIINLFYEKWKLIQDIQLFSLQIGISGPINIRGIGESNITCVAITEKLTHAIEKLYQIDRQIIQSLPLTGNPENLADVVYRFNNQNVCEFLDQLVPGGNFDFKFSKEECQLLEGRQYLTKGMRSGIIALLDKSQQILIQYKNCAKCDSPAIDFAKMSQHKLFQGLSFYFKKIIDYQLSIASRQINSSISNYKKIEIGINISGLILGLCVYFVLTIKMKKMIIESFKQLKGALFVISQKTIRESHQLAALVTSQLQFEYLA